MAFEIIEGFNLSKIIQIIACDACTLAVRRLSDGFVASAPAHL